MVTAFTALLVLLRELGLSTATIQRAEITHAQISVLFWINASAGVLMAGLLAVLARPIAWFYRTPELTNLVLVISLGLPLGGFAVQHLALLQRQMKYGTLAVIDLVSTASGVVAAIVCAWRGGGYWALAVMPIVGQTVTLAASWIACGWRPGMPRRGTGVRTMIDFGGHVAGFGVMNYLARNLDNILIGKFLGAGPLGLYSRAYGLLMMPLRQLNAPLAAVAVPALSRVASAPERYRPAYCEAVQQIQMICVPGTVLLICCADWVILLALGSQWRDAAGIYALLGLAGIVQPLANATGWLFTSQGRGKEMFHWGLMNGSLSIASFLIGLPWGASGVAAAYGASGLLIRAPLLFWYVTRRGPVKQSDLYRTLQLPFVAACAVACTVLGLRLLAPSVEPVLGLAVASVAATTATLAVYWLHPRGRANLLEMGRFLVNWLKHGVESSGDSR
jgi:PST family polysaccharide transporter